MNQFDRASLINKIQTVSEWDLIIIGGGATGLGVALDGAARGFKTLLLEQSDFAKGTSSRSTKLVHGGVRYMAQGDMRLVKEALRERGILLKNAPHITNKESIILPCYSWANAVIYGLGLSLYDWLAGKSGIGKSRIILRKEFTERMPMVRAKSLKCGILYHDGTFDDARLALNLAQTCMEHGGVALNYFRVMGLLKNNGIICGVNAKDHETGHEYMVKGKVVVNATGVFADGILQLDNPKASPTIRPSQGIHLVIDHSFLKSDNAMMIPHTEDGRVLFAIPWQNHVLLGTTDTPLEAHSLEPRALEEEIDFILRTTAAYLKKSPGRKDVLSVYAGLRPLAATIEKKKKSKEISRSHKVLISSSGLVSIIGGKWTTYRKMAADAFLAIEKKKMLPVTTCRTKNLHIYGYIENNSSDYLSHYGAEAEKIRELIRTNPSWNSSLSHKLSIHEAQIVWAVRNEMALTLEDVLARRIRLLFLDAEEAIRVAPKAALIIQRELNKDDNWRTEQLTSFLKLAKGYMLD